jgi:hypothetical protein
MLREPWDFRRLACEPRYPPLLCSAHSSPALKVPGRQARLSEAKCCVPVSFGGSYATPGQGPAGWGRLRHWWLRSRVAECTGAAVTVSSVGGHTVARRNARPPHGYAIALPPGKYRISGRDAPGPMNICFAGRTPPITLHAGQIIHVDLDCPVP